MLRGNLPAAQDAAGALHETFHHIRWATPTKPEAVEIATTAFVSATDIGTDSREANRQGRHGQGVRAAVRDHIQVWRL